MVNAFGMFCSLLLSTGAGWPGNVGSVARKNAENTRCCTSGCRYLFDFVFFLLVVVVRP